MRTVLCCVVYTTGVYSDTHAHTSAVHMSVGLGFGIDCWFRYAFCVFLPCYSCVDCFCCGRFSTFGRPTIPRDWLGRTSSN